MLTQPSQPHSGPGMQLVFHPCRLILPVDQDLGSYLLAVDKNTGKIRWKVDLPEVFSGYSTTMLYLPGHGPKQIIAAESF